MKILIYKGSDSSRVQNENKYLSVKLIYVHVNNNSVIRTTITKQTPALYIKLILLL